MCNDSITASGKGGIPWIDIDEHIGIAGLLAGKSSGESQRSFEQWLSTRPELT